MLASVGRRLLPDPFFALFALRRRYLREQSLLLYKRYGHALGILGAFFGLVLVEKPSMLAAPILQFWRDPLDWRANLSYIVGWLVVVGLWARVHRGFVRGAGFAVFARTASHGHRLAPLLDMALLLVALQWCVIPFAIAAWVVAGSGTIQFWACLFSILLLTVGAARAVVFGAGRASCVRLAAALALLVVAPRAGGWPLVVCAALLVFDLTRPSRGRVAHRRTGAASGSLRGPGLWFLFLLHCQSLWRAHLHVALPRICFALFAHALGWCLIFRFGKTGDAAGFIKLACCASAYVLAGLYYAFWQVRQPVQPFLRSMPYGVARTLAAEHMVVLGVGALVTGLAWLAYALAPAASPELTMWLLRCGGLSLVLLALLGAPTLQRHQCGVVMKVALTVAALLLM